VNQSEMEIYLLTRRAVAELEKRWNVYWRWAHESPADIARREQRLTDAAKGAAGE